MFGGGVERHDTVHVCSHVLLLFRVCVCVGVPDMNCDFPIASVCVYLYVCLCLAAHVCNTGGLGLVKACVWHERDRHNLDNTC